MSTDVAEQIADDPDNETEESIPTRRFDFGSKKVKIAALLLVVMTVEAVGFYLFAPQPAPSQGQHAGNEGSGQTAEAEQTGLDGDTTEVSIGSFNCTNSRASTGSIHVTFDLVAIVSANQAAKFELAANGINGVRKHRVRQAVVKVARSTNLEDLNDPNLSTMKRLIGEEINKVLRKSYVIEVVISDFRTMEQ